MTVTMAVGMTVTMLALMRLVLMRHCCLAGMETTAVVVMVALRMLRMEVTPPYH